jgi:hypothetical protein
MSKIFWKELRNIEYISYKSLAKFIDILGGDGITLEQFREACKEKVFSFPNAVKVATALHLPNWKKALGKVVAHVHSKTEEGYKDKDDYLHNQKALEEGRLEDINIAAAEAAAKANDGIWAGEAARRAGDTTLAAEAIRIAWAAEAATWANDNVNDLIDIYFDVLKAAD